jgi:G3E family GTPase
MEHPFFQKSPEEKANRDDSQKNSDNSRLPEIYRVPTKGFTKKFLKQAQSVIARFLGHPDPNRSVPVTVLTGFLGAGKTTLIVNLMKSLPKEYRVAWLKNEFGGTAVDSELAANNNIATVKEMLQGCICHVLIGQLGQALEEMLASDPDRIIIETSGSAAPAPIVWEIRKHPRLLVDGIITVIDAVNFPGYKDKSYTAKLQAKYTDLILINKHEQVSEHDLDRILDDVYELNPDTPKIKTENGWVAPDVLFGLDSRLFETAASVNEEESHVEKEHQHNEVDLIEITFEKSFSRVELETALKQFPKEHFYRIKGVVLVSEEPFILNWAFGSLQFIPIRRKPDASKIVFMGTHIQSFKESIKASFSVREEDMTYAPAGHHHHHDHEGHHHEHPHE